MVSPNNESMRLGLTGKKPPKNAGKKPPENAGKKPTRRRKEKGSVSHPAA